MSSHYLKTKINHRNKFPATFYLIGSGFNSDAHHERNVKASKKNSGFCVSFTQGFRSRRKLEIYSNYWIDMNRLSILVSRQIIIF